MDGSDTTVIARRLIALAERAEIRKKNPLVATKSVKEIFDEDEALMGESQPAATDGYARKPTHQEDTGEIHLRTLIEKLKQLGEKPQLDTGQAERASETLIAKRTSVQIEVKSSLNVLAPVEGLVRRSRDLAETDRYRFEFSDPTRFTIIDKWSDRSTTIWGDPHVDTDDQEGAYNGEFSDLKSSDTHTTLQLLDGTRVTFTARDNGVIEAVDLYQGSQHLRGLGAGSATFTPETSLFLGDVDHKVPDVPLGDVVRAGGDGNDWYDSSGKLVWGQTTGPTQVTRPTFFVTLEYNQIISQEITVVRRDLSI